MIDVWFIKPLKGNILGRSRGRLGVASGRSWGDLGEVLGSLGAILGGLGGVAVLGRVRGPGRILDHFWRPSGKQRR